MDFFVTLVRYETHLWNHLDRLLRRAGQVDLGTLAALRVLRDHPDGCRVQEIHADLGISVGAASKLVDRLERDGLARRSAHPHDRRSSIVGLTPAGTRAHVDGQALVSTALEEHLHGQVGIDDLGRALAHLLARLGETTPAVAR